MEKYVIEEACFEPCQTSKIELCAKIVKVLNEFTIVLIGFILDAD